MKRPTVHRIGDCSDTDRSGRLTRFKVQTMCGRRLGRGLLVTDLNRSITCGACIRVWVTPKWRTRAR